MLLLVDEKRERFFRDMLVKMHCDSSSGRELEMAGALSTSCCDYKIVSLSL